MTTNRITFILLMVVAAFTTTGCELVGDILEFGIWVGIIIVVVIIALVVWLLKKVFK